MIQDKVYTAEIITEDEYQSLLKKQNSVIEARYDANRFKSSMGRRKKHANADKQYIQRLTNQMNGMRW